jgi:hypothetical protein
MKFLRGAVNLIAWFALALLCTACNAVYTLPSSGENAAQENTRTPKPTLYISRPQATATPQITFLPFVGNAPCQTDTAILSIAAPGDTFSPGETVTATITLQNKGCTMLGLPLYRLNIRAAGSETVLEPAAPEPLMHSLAVQPGQSDSAQFTLQAANPGQATLSASASYEVHLGYPGPAYWGNASASPVELTVNPP